ncbi:hypothetical protein [Streptomyces sp. NPDC002671]
MTVVGGMGRTRNGSYAELVTVPATNVVAVNSSLGWAELAAVPEGFEPVRDFNPITDLPTGVQLSFFGSTFVVGSPDIPLSDVPLEAGAAMGKMAVIVD